MAERRGGARPGAGRPKGKVSAAKKQIAEAAKEYANDALKMLVQVAKDRNAPAAARVSAANSIIERGYGKPNTPVKHHATDRLAEAVRDISRRGSAAPIASDDDDERRAPK